MLCTAVCVHMLGLWSHRSASPPDELINYANFFAFFFYFKFIITNGWVTVRGYTHFLTFLPVSFYFAVVVFVVIVSYSSCLFICQPASQPANLFCTLYIDEIPSAMHKCQWKSDAQNRSWHVLILFDSAKRILSMAFAVAWLLTLSVSHTRAIIKSPIRFSIIESIEQAVF